MMGGSGFLFAALLAFVSCVQSVSYDGDVDAFRAFAPSPKKKTNAQKDLTPGPPLDLGISPLGFRGMSKRQSCSAGYGLCPYGPGRCCPDGCCEATGVCAAVGQPCCTSRALSPVCDFGEQCCLDGCAPATATCCQSGGYCESDEECCLDSCIPYGAQCCTDGSYCDAGNSCYSFEDTPNDIRCCTNSLCTAYVEGGITITRTTSQRTTRTTQTFEYTSYRYFYYTYTWYYYVYYYTLIQQTSRVTYSEETSTIEFSIYATNSLNAQSEASASFDTITETPPPSASTRLSTLLDSPPPSITQNTDFDFSGPEETGQSDSQSGGDFESAAYQHSVPGKAIMSIIAVSLLRIMYGVL